MEPQFPIGIDSDRFIHALEAPQVQEHIKELKERFSGRKVILLFHPSFYFFDYGFLVPAFFLYVIAFHDG